MEFVPEMGPDAAATGQVCSTCSLRHSSMRGAGCAAGQRPSAGRLRSLINDVPPTGDRETE